MRDKLIELISATEYGNGSLVGRNFQEGFIAMIADHLLANGVIVLPCKVGDTVWDKKAEPWSVYAVEWFARKVFHIRCKSLTTGRNAVFSVGKRSVGKTLFLSREAALKEGE